MEADQAIDDGGDDANTSQVDESSIAQVNTHNQHQRRQAPMNQTHKNQSEAAKRHNQKGSSTKFQRHERFKRIDTRRGSTQNTPSRNYTHVQAEMYGSGCKGKKFRKEKGKKKRSQYSGAIIDGSVRSVRLDT